MLWNRMFLGVEQFVGLKPTLRSSPRNFFLIPKKTANEENKAIISLSYRKKQTKQILRNDSKLI